MKIDAAVHFWRLVDDMPIGVNRRIAGIERDFTPEDLKVICRPLGVERVILVQAAPTEIETRLLLSLARDDPFVAAVIGWIDIEATDLSARIEDLASDTKFAGIRLMAADVAEPGWLNTPAVVDGVRAIAKRDLVLELLVRPTQLVAAQELLIKIPEVRAIINHCARPLIVAREWQPWAALMKRIGELPNTSCKYSGLIERGGFEWNVEMVRPYVEHLLEAFGPNRMIFASNWPIINLVGNYERWWRAAHESLAHSGLGVTELANIFGANAQRLYLKQEFQRPDRQDLGSANLRSV